MDDELRKILRNLFKLLMYENDGKSFQNIFELLMKKKYGDDFILIKPYGNIGDMKNDGYLISEKFYYQVYGPENIENSIKYAISKLNDDAEGLFSKWPDAKKIIYVVNDKFKGVKPTIAALINELDDAAKKLRGNLGVDVRIWGCRDLEEIFLDLDDADREDVIESPYYDNMVIDLIDFNELRDITNYIMTLPANIVEDNLFPPDYEDKIKVNGFSSKIAKRLEMAHLNADKIEDFFSNSSSTLADDIRSRIILQYNKTKYELGKTSKMVTKDEIYVELIDSLCRDKRKACVDATEAIIAYYFECCDIFESPNNYIGVN